MSDWHRRGGASLSSSGGGGGGSHALSGCTCGLALGIVAGAIVLGSLHPLLTLTVCLSVPAGLFLTVRRLRGDAGRSHRGRSAVFAFACAAIGLGYGVLTVVSLVLRVALLWELMTLNLLLVLACLSIRRIRATAALSSLSASLDETLEAASAPDVCAVCERSMPQLDHHCWWLDCCIGRANRRQYMLILLLCIATGCYAVQLTATSICTPAIYLDWFLLPSDCRFLYHNSLNSIALSACAFVSVCVAMLCCELAVQAALVTAGVTWQELARGSSDAADLLLDLLSRVLRRRGACAAAWLELCCLRR